MSEQDELVKKVINYINPIYPLNLANRAFVTQQVRTVDIGLLTNHQQCIPVLSKIIIDKLKKSSVDIKEYMKSNIGQAEHQINDRIAPLNLTDLMRQPKTAQSIFNPVALERTTYLKLDSQSATLNGTYYTWQISSINSVVFTPQPIVNAVRFRMLPMVIPWIEAYGSMVAVDIMEINNQVYRDASPLRYAFVFRSSPLTTNEYSPILLTDLSLTSEIRLINPLAELTQISIGFYNPYAPIVWPSALVQAVASANGQNTRLTFATSPYLAIGDLIIITGWRATGYNIINTANNTVDIGHILADNEAGNVTVQLCSKKFVVNIEVTFLPGF